MEWKDNKTPSKITSVNLNAIQIAADVSSIHNAFVNHLFFFYLFFKAY